MSRIKNVTGTGYKRRIRLRMHSTDSTTIVVERNRSKKPTPANWREMLIAMVNQLSDRPPRHFYRGGVPVPARSISRPLPHIPQGSLPSSMIVFMLDSYSGNARLQRRVIDWSITQSDVKNWPVPKPSSHLGAGGEKYVNTGLYLHDTLVGDVHHSFNPTRLRGVEGIDWRHLQSYTARKGEAQFLGIKTTCGEPCECRRKLLDVWPLGWEMHN